MRTKYLERVAENILGASQQEQARTQDFKQSTAFGPLYTVIDINLAPRLLNTISYSNTCKSGHADMLKDHAFTQLGLSSHFHNSRTQVVYGGHELRVRMCSTHLLSYCQSICMAHWVSRCFCNGCSKWHCSRCWTWTCSQPRPHQLSPLAHTRRGYPSRRLHNGRGDEGRQRTWRHCRATVRECIAPM